MSLDLTDVSETLWIPLFGKAIESKRVNGLLNDPKAIEIAEKACELNPKLNRWWKSLSRESQGLMIWRNEAIDEYVQDYLQKYPNGLIVNLGAGLCTRFDRLDNGSLTWVEVDLPQVKSAWLNFNEESDRHQYHTDSIFEEKWIKNIKSIQSENVLFIAEGLLMYFSKEEVKSIFNTIAKELSNSFFVLEAYSKFALMRPHPDVLRTGAKKFKDQWRVKTGKDFEKFNPCINHISDHYFLSNKKALRRVPLSHKFGAKFPLIAKAGKIVYLNFI